MAPLDTMSGEAFLAEFEAMVGRADLVEGRAPAARDEPPPSPERRAVNWANALARIVDEIQQRQGRRSAESLLRTVGARIARDLLTPLPDSREAFEPAINRALSSLDWGWVAIAEREDAIVFEHRAPWPFENRTTHLPAVLEGFFSDTLQRLSGDERAEVKAVGRHGTTLTFEWRPLPPEPETDVAIESPPEPVTAEAVVESEATVEAEVAAPDLQAEEAPAPAGFELPKIALGPAFSQWRERNRSADPTEARSNHSTSALVVAAIVFFGLFGLGLLTGGGDLAGALLHSVRQLIVGGSAPAAGLQSRVHAGDANAEITVALRLASGNNPDYVAAAGLLKKAATAGSAEAQYDLGVMYETGIGVAHDPVEAAILFMNAAATGHAMAQYRLGVAYEKGLGVAHNATNAAMWYERAARQGIRVAQTAMGRLYQTGTGVTADPVAAYAWYRVAEENGDADARDRLAPLWAHMTVEQRAEARRQALRLIGDIGTKDTAAAAPHHSIEEVLGQAS